MPSTLVTPELIYTPFGVGAANPTYIRLPIPVPSQIGTTPNQASFTDGFPPSTMTPEASGGLPFFGQDMNGILWMITAYCANFAAGALSPYNSTLSTAVSGYPANAVLLSAANAGLWVNIGGSGNTTNPDGGSAAGWAPLATAGYGTVAVAGTNITLTLAQSALPLLIFIGTLTANVTVTLTAVPGQEWVLINNASGAFTLSVVWAGGGSPIAIPATGPGSPTSAYLAPAGIFNTGVNTAGLAPLASPALTGIPTAPTASTATNTTQLATTAFAHAAITAALASYAPLASPTFSGVPTAPTAAANTNNAQLATTQYADRAVAAVPIVKGAQVALTTGSNSVAFSSAFPTACSAVSLTPFGANATVNITSKSASGFVCVVGVSQSYDYIAVGN